MNVYFLNSKEESLIKVKQNMNEVPFMIEGMRLCEKEIKSYVLNSMFINPNMKYDKHYWENIDLRLEQAS